MNNSIVYSVSVIVAIALGLTLGYTLFHTEEMSVGTSSTGTTFSTAKIAEVVMAPQSVTATSSSILNTDSSDRYVTDAGVYCTGLTTMFGMNGAGGLVTFDYYAGTTSSAAPTAAVTSNPLLAMRVSVATATPNGFTATSTFTNPYARVWNSGSYLTFQTNGTSSAAICTPYVRYIAS